MNALLQAIGTTPVDGIGWAYQQWLKMHDKPCHVDTQPLKDNNRHRGASEKAKTPKGAVGACSTTSPLKYMDSGAMLR